MTHESFVVIVDERIGEIDEGVKMAQKSMISFEGVKVHNVWVCKFLRVKDNAAGLDAVEGDAL